MENPDIDGPFAVSVPTSMIDDSPLPTSVQCSAVDTALGQCAEQASISCNLPLHESTIPPSSTQATENPSLDGMVDSALISAMRDPRERVAVLKLEQSMLEFMRNTELQTINVGGSYNSVVVGLRPSQSIPEYTTIGRATSFQRCCLHRLCDRFKISRESIDMDWISLIKTEQSSVPQGLLIDLVPSQYTLDEQMSTLAVTKPGKMKIIKRSPSDSFGSSGSLMEKSERKKSNKKNLTEKEKAYAEARARIFNDLNEGDEGMITSSEAATVILTPSQVEIPNPTTCHEPPSRQGERPKAVNKGGVSKVTWRNRQQEEADPDFRRQQPGQYYTPGYTYPQPSQYYGQYDQQYFIQQPVYQGEGYNGVPTSASIGGRVRGREKFRGGRGKQTDVTSIDDFPALG